MNIYLDIDSVLNTKNGKPAVFCKDFIRFLVENFDCYWLTTHCKRNNENVLKYLSSLKTIVFELNQIKPTQWDTLKTEAIDFSTPFLWIGDTIFDKERENLLLHHCEECFIQLNSFENPEYLLNIMSTIKSFASIENAAYDLVQADAVIVLAGAGMSADAGLPVFRVGDKVLNSDYVLKTSGKYNKQHIDESWKYWKEMIEEYLQTAPHKGYYDLLEVCEDKKDGYFVITTNIDGLFEKTGFAEDRIVEKHGNIKFLQCSNSCSEELWKLKLSDEVPRCPLCNEHARPNVRMFDDINWIGKQADKIYEYFVQWKNKISNRKVVILEIGAGKGLPVLRGDAEILASIFKATLIRINEKEAFSPKNQISIPMKALNAISLLSTMYGQIKNHKIKIN